jgi:hypothetical protein
MAASEKETSGARSSEGGTTKAGPANPQGSGSMDMPSPPGGPLRSDTPSGAVTPGGPGTPAQPGEPQEVKRPEHRVQEPGPDEQPPPVLTGDDNAQSSQLEPSDDSGGE